MTSFLRFFVLALTPLLAVTVSFGPAMLFGLVATVVLLVATTLVYVLRDKLKESALLWSVLGLNAVLITLVDLVTSMTVPGVREAWGLYLNLLAFSPLVVLLPLEKPQAPDLGSELSLALKTGVLLILLFSVTALVREFFGRGSVTLLPGVDWKVPLLNDAPLSVLVTGAGGFFLAAAAVVAYRAVRPRLLKLESVSEFRAAGQGSFPMAAPRPGAKPHVAAPALPESTDDWGEHLESVVASLPAGRRKLLVIGVGTGELAYYLAMLCLGQNKGAAADFRVKGVDHFATRIETAVKGVYREHHIDFIPAAVRDAWMTRGKGDDRVWRVDNDARLHVQFEVADFQSGPLFFPQPCHVIVLNQGIEYVSNEKKVQLLKTVCDHLLPGGALIAMGPFRRELLPEGMKRTGTIVFRKS